MGMLGKKIWAHELRQTNAVMTVFVIYNDEEEEDRYWRAWLGKESVSCWEEEYTKRKKESVKESLTPFLTLFFFQAEKIWA